MTPFVDYAGAVGAFAVYRAPVIGMLGMLPSLAGIASYAVPELDTLRGVDAHRAARQQAIDARNELHASTQGASFTDDEKAEFEAYSEFIKAVDPRIEELEVRDAIIAEATGNQATSKVLDRQSYGVPQISRSRIPDNIYDLGAYRAVARDLDELPALYRDGAMKALERADFPTALDRSKAQASIEKIIAKHSKEKNGAVSRRIIATSDPDYIEAWASAMRGQVGVGRRMAVLQTYVDADGGVAIPVVIDPTFINTSDGSVNPLRAISRIETTTGKTWQATTTGGVTASYVGERTTTGGTDSAPADFDDPTVTPVRADTTIDITLEYDQDYGHAGLLTEIGNLVQSAKDDLEADQFFQGDGNLAPEGIVWFLDDDGSSLVNTITNDVYALADIDKLINQTPPRFRSRGQFCANLGILQLSAGFGTAGQPGNSIYDPIAGTLRGYRVHEATAMDDVATDGKEILLFGDFNQFVIVDRLGVTSKVIDAVDTNGRPTGNSRIYVAWRNGTKTLFANAFRLLKVQ